MVPWHPVALFGRYAAWLEQYTYGDSRLAGATHVVLATCPAVAGAYLLHRRAPMLSLAGSLLVALGGTTLERTGTRMANALREGDIEQARALVPWLCSRDPEALDAAGIAKATVESLAENTSDAAIAPLCFALAGAPGVVLHRVVNTLDAMVGYHNPRYEQFGWAAAKLDDILAYIPARVTAGVHIALAAAEGRATQAWQALRNDAPNHPSPNAGPVEATAAACLGVQLGGTTVYPHGVEERPTMGRGRAPSVEDIDAAVRLSKRVQAIVGAGAAITAGAMGLMRQRRRGRLS